MGDAGPPTPDPLVQQAAARRNGEIGAGDAPRLREVKVLVTGFGVGVSLFLFVFFDYVAIPERG